MKKGMFISLFIVILINSIIAQNIKGGLGDVRYSILPPDSFIEQNDSGWVLMDGRDIKGSDLHSCCGISQIPDARGMFIRGLSLKRNDGKEDPYQKENNDTSRKVGSYQPDAFKEHKHSYTHFNGGIITDMSNDQDQRKASYGTMVGALTGEQGESKEETRPKNIALYIYIKINK